MRRYTRTALYGAVCFAAGLALLVVALLGFGGCGKPDHETTPRYGMRVYSSVPVDLDALDTAWEAALGCWQTRLARTLTVAPPYVEVVTRGLVQDGRCAWWSEGGRGVYGECGSRSVRVAPDGCAARHEFSHWIERAATGRTEAVRTGCDGSGSDNGGGGW